MVKRGNLEWYNDPVGRALVGAVRQAVEFHGPITGNHTKINSVVKRVYGVLKRLEQGAYNQGRQDAIRRLRASERLKRCGMKGGCIVEGERS